MMTAKVKKFHKDGSVDDPSCFNLVNVKVGDLVCFKSDFEQQGKIVTISQRDRYSHVELSLENPNGFGGEYLRYATRTTVYADDCWL